MLVTASCQELLDLIPKYAQRDSKEASKNKTKQSLGIFHNDSIVTEGQPNRKITSSNENKILCCIEELLFLPLTPGCFNLFSHSLTLTRSCPCSSFTSPGGQSCVVFTAFQAPYNHFCSVFSFDISTKDNKSIAFARDRDNKNSTCIVAVYGLKKYARLLVRRKKKPARSLFTLSPPSFPPFLRLDYASRQMVPVCWLFSIYFLSSQTATLPPSALSPPPSLPFPPPSLSLPPPPNGSSVMWVEIIFYCPVVRK